MGSSILGILDLVMPSTIENLSRWIFYFIFFNLLYSNMSRNEGADRLCWK